MTPNKHVYAICCRLEVAGNIVSGKNVKTVENYAVLHFEVASFSSFEDIKSHFMTTAAEADIDNRIKRKCIRVSFNYFKLPSYLSKHYLHHS